VGSGSHALYVLKFRSISNEECCRQRHEINEFPQPFTSVNPERLIIMQITRANRMNATTNADTSRLESRSLVAKKSAVGRVLGMFTLALLLVTALSASAQTVRFRATRVRITVPLNYSGTDLITNLATISTNVASPVNFAVTGLPAGASYTLTDQNTNVLTSSMVTTNLYLWVHTTNVAQGTYTFSLNGSGGAVNNILFILQAGHVWNGSTNAVVDGSGSWSDASKWLGGVPGAGDDVIFTDSGGQTNYFTTLITNIVGGVTNISTNFLVNSVIDSDTTIGSLRFSQLSNNTTYHVLNISPGRTLSITGTNGFSFLRDYIEDNTTGSPLAPPAGWADPRVTFLGTNATMVVSNDSANFALLIPAQRASHIDMTQLDRFEANVVRFGLGDYSLYPNYGNYNYANQYPDSGSPKRFLANVSFARTNILRASFADPYHYTNVDDRKYSFTFLNSSRAGTTAQALLQLGISNAFFCDGVNILGANQQGNLRFNPTFANNTNFTCSAYFRNTNGGRMSMFAIADGAGTNEARSHTKALNLDFSGGTLDILADKFYIGRDRPLLTDCVYQGFFLMGRGTVDVNTVVLGYQEYAGQTNTTEFRGYCQGRISMTNNPSFTNSAGLFTNSGIFKVNDTLILGYVTQTDTYGLGDSGNGNYGQVFLGNGSTLAANRILIGNPSYTTPASFTYGFKNVILVTNRSSLIISNTMGTNLPGTTDGHVVQLDMRNSSLTLHPTSKNFFGPYVCVTNLFTDGAILNLATVPVWPTNEYPKDITLIQFETGSSSFTLGACPFDPTNGSPTYQPATPTLINNSTSVVLHLDILYPQVLIWKGFNDGNWDFTTQNWATTNGLTTNFHNGDFVIFDDRLQNNIDVTITTNVMPGQAPGVFGITVNNSGRNIDYTFGSSGGSVIGSQLRKQGTKSLTINAPMSTAIEIAGGSVSGNGSVSAVTVNAGTTLNFSGSINSTLTTAGTATSAGTVNGQVVVQTGGVFTNNGTVNGTLAVQSAAWAVNNGTWRIGSSTTSTNSTLINAGSIVGNSLVINGRFIDMGSALGSLTLDTALTIGGGSFTGGNDDYITNRIGAGTFIPGGDGLGVTYVYKGECIGNPCYNGRIDFARGSTNIYKVDPGAPSGSANTKTRCGFQSFGPSQSAFQFNGCTILITNVGTTPFAASQSYKLFSGLGASELLNNPGQNTTNTYPTILPPTPGPGLAWDLRNLWMADAPGQNGIIRIVSVATNPISLTPSYSYGTNYSYATNVVDGVTNVVTTTNTLYIAQFQWPTNYIGWRLEQQNRALNEGISTNRTAWSTTWNTTAVSIVASPWTNFMLTTNTLYSVSPTRTNRNPGCYFYRMVYP
jgi:hypothetical protein